MIPVGPWLLPWWLPWAVLIGWLGVAFPVALFIGRVMALGAGEMPPDTAPLSAIPGMLDQTVNAPTSPIRRARENLGLSQEQLARLIGCTRSTVVEVERGRQVPSITLALDFAQALGQPIEALFPREVAQ